MRGGSTDWVAQPGEVTTAKTGSFIIDEPTLALAEQQGRGTHRNG